MVQGHIPRSSLISGGTVSPAFRTVCKMPSTGSSSFWEARFRYNYLGDKHSQVERPWCFFRDVSRHAVRRLSHPKVGPSPSRATSRSLTQVWYNLPCLFRGLIIKRGKPRRVQDPFTRFCASGKFPKYNNETCLIRLIANFGFPWLRRVTTPFRRGAADSQFWVVLLTRVVTCRMSGLTPRPRHAPQLSPSE